MASLFINTLKKISKCNHEQHSMGILIHLGELTTLQSCFISFSPWDFYSGQLYWGSMNMLYFKEDHLTHLYQSDSRVFVLSSHWLFLFSQETEVPKEHRELSYKYWKFYSPKSEMYVSNTHLALLFYPPPFFSTLFSFALFKIEKKNVYINRRLSK